LMGLFSRGVKKIGYWYKQVEKDVNGMG
jgi:hypothetical protein